MTEVARPAIPTKPGTADPDYELVDGMTGGFGKMLSGSAPPPKKPDLLP